MGDKCYMCKYIEGKYIEGKCPRCGKDHVISDKEKLEKDSCNGCDHHMIDSTRCLNCDDYDLWFKERHIDEKTETRRPCAKCEELEKELPEYVKNLGKYANMGTARTSLEYIKVLGEEIDRLTAEWSGCADEKDKLFEELSILKAENETLREEVAKGMRLALKVEALTEERDELKESYEIVSENLLIAINTLDKRTNKLKAVEDLAREWHELEIKYNHSCSMPQSMKDKLYKLLDIE